MSNEIEKIEMLKQTCKIFSIEKELLKQEIAQKDAEIKRLKDELKELHQECKRLVNDQNHNLKLYNKVKDEKEKMLDELEKEMDKFIEFWIGNKPKQIGVYIHSHDINKFKKELLTKLRQKERM